MNISEEENVKIGFQEYSSIRSIEASIFEIKKAISRDSICLPSIELFRHHFYFNKRDENISYISTLLHDCWRWIFPSDTANKARMNLSGTQAEEAINAALSKYRSPDGSLLPQEMDRSIYDLASHHAFGFLPKYQYVYKKYFEEVHSCLKKLTDEKGWRLLESFIIDASIPVTSLSRKKINEIAEYLISEKYIASEDKANFIASFKDTISLSEGCIIWKDINKKTKKPAIASLYLLFKLLGLDMNQENKNLICRLIYDSNGQKIDPSQLKERNKSPKLTQFENGITNILNAP